LPAAAQAQKEIAPAKEEAPPKVPAVQEQRVAQSAPQSAPSAPVASASSPEPSQVAAPVLAEPSPAKPAKKKPPSPVQVAAVEQPKPGPLFPKKGYGDEQVAHFLAAALPAPDAAVPGRLRLLTRWQGDVRLQVTGRNAAGAMAQVRAAAEEIAAALARGGRIKLAAAEPANLQVYVLPSGPGTAAGYVQNTYDGAVITGSKVVLYADRAGRAAVLGLLLEALGLPGKVPAGQDSVLAAVAPTETGLSDLDRSSLDLLYNPVLAPGMDMASARQAVNSLR
jgi:hypothetical protein